MRMIKLGKEALGLTAWVGVYLAIAAVIGKMTRSEIPGWYWDLQKPELNPPDFVFGIVWPILYIMIAIAGWRLWGSRRSRGGRLNFALFALQSVLNWGWSYVFFYYHHIEPALIVLGTLVLAVEMLIVRLSLTDRKTMFLLLPYFIWIIFAFYLNAMIWKLN